MFFIVYLTNVLAQADGATEREHRRALYVSVGVGILFFFVSMLIFYITY